MSNQYPGQPGDLPPTQVAPGNVPPQQPGYPPPPGYPQPPQQPYGAAPGGGGGYPPPGGPSFPAPPTGGGGGKKVLLIVGLVVAVLILIGGGITAALVLGGDDDDDDAKDPVTQTTTLPTVDTSVPTTPPTSIDTSLPTTPPTTPATTEAGGPPLENAEIIARAYLDSLITSNCLAVQGLSTPEWWSTAYGNERGCQRAGGNVDMSALQYAFEASVDNGDGSATVVASVTDIDGAVYTVTWVVVPSDDGTSWLVNAFQVA